MFNLKKGGGGGGVLSAYEPESIAAARLKERGYTHIYKTPEAALDNSYDLIGLFDVIEHVEHDGELAKKIYGSLHNNGVLCVTTGAYQWLWSKHDVSHKHFRRYTKSSLCRVLESAGFTIEYAGYWNMSLLIPLIGIRFFGGTGESGFNAPHYISAPVTWLLKIEACILRFVPLPFGISVIVKARK